MRRSCFFAAIVALCTSLWAAKTSAQHDNTDAFRALVGEAMALYEAQQYAEAVELFERAYEMSPDPILVYNIGRAYERSLRRELAVEYYERFLSLPATTALVRARVLENLEALRAEMAALERARDPQPEGPPDEPEPTAQPDPSGGEAAPPAESRRSLVAPGWVLVGAGAVTLVLGSVFGGLAIRSNDRFEEAVAMDDQLRLRDDVNRNAAVADAMFGLATACVVTGAILLIVDAIRRNRSGQQSLLLRPTGPFLGAMVTARF